MWPSPLTHETITFRLTSSKTSGFTMHYYTFNTTLERNAHFRPQFDPKLSPFWPQTTPKHTQQLRRPVFYDRFTLSPPPLSNETSTRPSKKAFGSRVIVSFIENDTTLEPNARLSHFLGGGGGEGAIKGPQSSKESIAAPYFTIENEGHLHHSATEWSFFDLNDQKWPFRSRVMKALIFSTVILHTLGHFVHPASPQMVIIDQSGEGEGVFASRNT